VDTGSSTTLLSWNEVPYATLKTNLREDRIYTAMGGSFKAFILPECSLFFYTNTGIHSLGVGDLGLSNYLTVDVDYVQLFHVFWELMFLINLIFRTQTTWTKQEYYVTLTISADVSSEIGVWWGETRNLFGERVT
jgi:hypothetical protein